MNQCCAGEFGHGLTRGKLSSHGWRCSFLSAFATARSRRVRFVLQHGLSLQAPVFNIGYTDTPNQNSTHPAGTMTTSSANRNRSLHCLQASGGYHPNADAVRGSTKGLACTACSKEVEQLEVCIFAVKERPHYQELAYPNYLHVVDVFPTPINTTFSMSLMAAVYPDGCLLQVSQDVTLR